MVCYAVPLAAAVISSKVWRAQDRGPSGWWLNLLLYGGVIFGLVDHLWWGELFLLGPTPVCDILCGVAITATIFASWKVTILAAKANPKLARQMGYSLGVVRKSR